MWYALIFDKAAPEEISDHENEAAIRAYEEDLVKRQEQELAAHRERNETIKEVTDFLGAGVSDPESSNVDYATNLSGPAININPLALALLPVQQTLGEICRVVRIIRSLLMWDECYVAFIIWNVCAVTGVLFLFV
jgi:hypothetical protein